jgi:hypothetical protein
VIARVAIDFIDVMRVQRGLDVRCDRVPVLHGQPKPGQLLDPLTQFGLGGEEHVEQVALSVSVRDVSVDAQVRGAVRGWPTILPM